MEVETLLSILAAFHIGDVLYFAVGVSLCTLLC